MVKILKAVSAIYYVMVCGVFAVLFTMGTGIDFARGAFFSLRRRLG